jgi:ADP-dependent NAD(P)H-hydrate dehydratase / NAD(P)H-hydrate epimerase
MDAVAHLGPTPASVPLLSAEEAAAGDQAAVDAGDSWAALMERAAGHLARGIVDAAGFGYGLRVALVCGKGNNGGDGWAAARRVRSAGAQPRVVAVQGLDADMSDEGEANRDRYLRSGGWATGIEGLDGALAWCDVAVDCLLGTGATGAPRGDVGIAVDALAGERRPDVVVACDLPTGVQGDDGVVPGSAVRADLTVTFGGVKRGLLLHPGRGYAGRVVVGELGPRYAPSPPAWRALTARGAAPTPLAADDDKRSRGVVLVVGGSVGMVGAAILTAAGALAAGAGLVTLAVPRSVQDVAAGALPPALTLGLEDEAGTVSSAAVDEVLEHASRSQVVAAGMGMRPTPGTRDVCDALLGCGAAVVLDADGVNVYRGDRSELATHAGPLVLTPQHRELARIADIDDGETALTGRADVVPRLAAELDAVVVGKGPATVVGAPDGASYVTPVGGPSLGAGGTGDLLAGMIAAAVARGDGPARATARACWWHGAAGELAGADAAGASATAAVGSAIPAALGITAALAEARPAWPFDAPGWHRRRSIAEVAGA